MISVLIPYRNREITRVKRCLDSIQDQTFTDFEVIFVDNGSDEVISDEVKKVTASYSFCKYVHTHTRGLIWNRSYALNVGSKLSSGDILVMADIDLLFKPDFFNKINGLNFTGNFYNYRCFYLPERYDYEKPILENTEYEGYRHSGNSRGLLIITKKDFELVNGYDEYYQQWGVEDDDLDKRLKLVQLTQHYLNENEYVSLHQWHKESYANMPTKWYLHMLNYCGENKETKRNLNGYGRIVNRNERVDFEKKVGQDNSSSIIPNKYLSVTGFNEIITAFFKSEPNQTIYIKYQQPDDFKREGFTKRIKNFLLHYFIKNEHLPDQNAVLARSYLTTETLFDFMVYFISTNRIYIKDYHMIYKPQNSLDVFILRNN